MSRSHHRSKYPINPNISPRAHKARAKRFVAGTRFAQYTFGWGSFINPYDCLDEVGPLDLPKVARLPRAAQEG